MPTSKKKLSPLTEALLEMAESQHRIGLMDDAAYRKITIRHLGPQTLPTSEPISGDEIRTLREKANLSQAAFARYLNLTVGYISQLERGTKQPKGPSADPAQPHSPQGPRSHYLKAEKKGHGDDAG